MMGGRVVEAHGAADEARRRSAAAVPEDRVAIADLLVTELVDARRGEVAKAWVVLKAGEQTPDWQVIGELVDPDKPTRSEKLEVVESGPVRARLRVKRGYDKSAIAQDVLVYRDLDVVEFALDVDWQQKGSRQKGGPFLKARFALDVEQPRARYAIPFGDIERPMDGDEVPALQWADVGNAQWGAAVLNDCKSGHSARDGTLRLSLIRSSCEPDPEPDLGRHSIRFALFPHAGSIHDGQVPRRGFEFGTPPVAEWIGAGRGDLPREKSFLSVDGALPTGLKMAEEGDAWVLRFYEPTGVKTTAVLRGAARSAGTGHLRGRPAPGDPYVAPPPLRPYTDELTPERIAQMEQAAVQLDEQASPTAGRRFTRA